jgi:hypothetical protein
MSLLLLEGVSAPPVIGRPPLPPWPEPVDYRTTLPWDPPHTRDFLRADSWGVTLPGLPWVPGASSEHPERALSWFLDRYPADWQRKYLETYVGYGYTHFRLSLPDSVAPTTAPPNCPPGAGRSLDQFLATCKQVQSYGLFCRVMLGSKCFQPHDMSAQQWADYSDPLFQALVAAKAVDEVTLGWEWDLWNVPGETTINAFRHLGQQAHAAGISCWMHFSPHVTSWFADGDPRGRFGFYDDLHGDVDGIDYQGDSSWDCAMMQARIVDTLWQFGTSGNRYKFRFDEDVAILQFSHDHPDEDDANLRGYVACCTIDDVHHTDAKVWGAGNGLRRPDGSRI